MKRIRTFQKKKMFVMVLIILGVLLVLTGRLTWIMIFRSEFYGQKAEDLHEKEEHQGGARGDPGQKRGCSRV